jgi:predicted Rossmann fold flavoprotein
MTTSLRVKRIAVIGGGAAGFFTALNIEAKEPAEITIYEKTGKLLSKVRISGGGRCNVTNQVSEPSELVKNYPRGRRELLGPFHGFSSAETIEWFKNKGVRLKTEPDGRIFPVTDSSETIIDCFLDLALKKRIKILQATEIRDIKKTGSGFLLETNQGIFNADFVVLSSGGNTGEALQNSLMNFGHHIQPSVPSLFTFNIPAHPAKKLMGLSVADASVRIHGTKLEENGPVLITHWGFSGPAILKLSAWGARILAGMNYKFEFSIAWTGERRVDEILTRLAAYREKNQQKKLLSNPLELPKRLWEYILETSGLNTESPWQSLSKQSLRKVAERICSDTYKANGKTIFKEEFVTCGGIDLKEIDFKTMQSRLVEGLYFAGEVIDIDGVTGGFNFQSAWTTAWIAASDISRKLK